MVLLQTASFDSSFQMAEFTTALINGKNTACKSVLIDLAEAERREQKNNEKPKSRTKQQPNKSKNKQHKNNPSSPSISGLTADPWMIMDVWQLCSTDLNQENKKALDFIPFRRGSFSEGLWGDICGHGTAWSEFYASWHSKLSMCVHAQCRGPL
jgi:hypothetical protein